MLRARRVQALTVFLLSMVATAAAVAGPVALGTVDLAVIRNEVAHASTQERSVAVTSFTDPSDRTASSTFDSIAGFLMLPGFEVIRGGELDSFMPQLATSTAAHGDATSRVAFRDRLC